MTKKKTKPEDDSMPGTMHRLMSLTRPQIQSVPGLKPEPAASHKMPAASQGLPGAAIHKVAGNDRHYKPQFNVRVNPELLKQINEYCFAYGLTKEEFLDRAASHMVAGTAASMLAHDDHDDKLVDDTAHTCARMYRQYTGQPWKPRDARDSKPYLTAEPRLIEIAILLTVERKLRGRTGKEPIKSFAYFIPEIEKILEQERAKKLPLAISDYHRYILGKWEKELRPLCEKWRKG